MSDALGIALVCYPSAGGSGIVATELAAGLCRRGHRVHVISSSPPHRGLPLADGLHFHAVQVPNYPVFEHPPYTLAVAAAIVRVAQQHAIDVVHSHYAVPHAASAQLAAQALGVETPALLTTLHGTDVTLVGSDPSFASIARATTAACDGLSVPSEYLRRQALNWLDGTTPPPIEVIGNFVDVDRFAPRPKRSHARFESLFAASPAHERDAPVLVHVSNFRPIKRVGDALEVLARVRRVRPARLCLIGEGPERAMIERRAHAMGLRSSVAFLGRRVDVADWLPDADAFLLTSENESFGLAALEAMACGVPVCGYAVGGLPEVVSERSGRLLPLRDLDGLGQAVLEVIAAGDAHELLRAGAREHVLQHFRSEPALERYEAWYRRSLANKPRRRYA